jgi:hypothetical protein
MRKTSLLLLLAGILLSNNQVHAERKHRKLSTVCGRITEAGNASSTIYKQSAPLRSGGIGTPIVGFRQEPTLIMNRNISSRGTKPIYDSKGNRLATCPWASAHGHSGGRFRCTVQTSSLRRAAIRNTKSPSIFFNVTGKSCVRVPDAGRCVGSVKGQCDRLIS